MERKRGRARFEDGASNGGKQIMVAPAVYAGGQFKPLSDHEVTTIIDNTFSILDRIGLGGAPEWLLRKLEETGARRRSGGRITFSRTLVEDTIARSAPTVNLPGFDRF